jgi:signal transduction histidine kinase
VELCKKAEQNIEKLNNQKQQIVIAVLIIFTLVILVISLYQSRADKLKINRVLQEKNTEISRQHEEIEKKAAELHISNNQKDKLFSVIAHDLRSPFISLQSLLTLIKDDALPMDKVKEILVKLNVNVDYTVDLVTNLLYWASSQMNGFSVTSTSFSLNSIVAEVLAGMEKPAADKGIVLVDKTPPNLNIFADKDMIALVIRNLLSNAVKFCGAGNSITVCAENKGTDTEVCIADDGTGIAEAILQKINNGESITTYGTSKEKGTGLGLLLCKDFVARNHGVFRIESVPGKGSSFYFTLKNTE